MKHLLVVASIAVTLQLSLAASVRVKRNDFVSNDPLVYYKTTKALVQKFEPLIKAVISDLPSTDPYRQHKQDLENYLLRAADTNATKDICFFKVFKTLEDFIEVLTPYKENASSDEAKQVLELFIKHGYNELDKEFRDFVEGYDVEAFGKRVDKLTATDDYELLELC